MAKTLIYQLYPIAWEGGLKAMTEHLKVISFLGADYVWLSPLYPSPRKDGGYDIADYESIDPRFGTMEDFDEFVKIAHSNGIGVLMDLVLNHTSVDHPWFTSHPEYYCHTDSPDKYNWNNLFDNSNNVWEPDPNYTVKGETQYYLHMFHKGQADLNWFPHRNYNERTGKPNPKLVKEFQEIVKFWMKKHDVDGFRLDVPQAINKDINQPELVFSDLLFGWEASEVINAIFTGEDKPFLVMECLDTSFGGLTEYYYKNTEVDFVMNILVKKVFGETGSEDFERVLDASASDSGYMLDLESHDSPRFPSYGMPPEQVIWTMFTSGAEGICLYQGQELGLKNPTKEELTDEMMIELDAETAMRVANGENIDALRPLSRANARVPLPMDEYEFQHDFPDSYLNLTKTWIERWKQH